MSGRDMEGDNRYRRKRARAARRRGVLPSEAGATLGSSKQRREVDADYPETLVAKHDRKQPGSGIPHEEPKPTWYDDE